MACFHPVPGWYAAEANEKTGKRSIVFTLQGARQDEKTQVPCGQCLGCRLERSRQWAIRCMHEAKMWERNVFVTLTYNEESYAGLPFAETGRAGLETRDYVLFMKRLRKARPIYASPRFFHCGEYGEEGQRPHHHALLFNCDFDDKRVWRKGSDSTTYVSDELERLWGHGHCSIGECNFKTASYVARYSMKKVVGPEAADWYAGRLPEYLTMSRRPGIGATFYERFKDEIYAADSCIVNGNKVKPPKFYDMRHEKLHPEEMQIIKEARRHQGAMNEDNSPERKRVKERTAVLRIAAKKRTL